MKGSTKIFFILGLSILITFIGLLYFEELVTPQESELIKYPHMNPFLLRRVGFTGIQHNLDTGYYSFAFSTSYKDIKDYFRDVHVSALAEGWEPIESQDLNKRIYHKPTNGPFSVMMQVTLLYNPSSNEITFLEEPKYAKSG